MGKGKGCMGGIFEEPASIFFWSLIFVMFVIVIGNFILTLSIISLFKIGFGLEAFELVPEAKSVKFFGTTDFKTVFKKDGLIESFRDVPLVIEADNEDEISINLVDRKGHHHNRMSMSGDGTEIKGIKEFIVRDPSTKESIFTTTSKMKYNINKPVRNLESTSVRGTYFASPIDKKLTLNADMKMHIRGVEGTTVDAKKLHVVSDKNISFKSYNGSIILRAPKIFIETSRLPIVETNYPSIDRQFKLCICYPKGIIYRAAVPKDKSDKDAFEYDTCRYAAKNYCT